VWDDVFVYVGSDVADLDTVLEIVAVRVSVRSTDALALTLFDIVCEAVSEAVKLGDTGDFVTEGVGVTDGTM